MTIVVASVSPEGIALAADSRTTQGAGSAHRRVSSESAHKVFESSGRFGIATYGIATIAGPRVPEQTIRGIFREWSASIGGDESISAFAEQLREHFQRRLAEATPARRGGAFGLLPRTWPLGFLVAGYDEDGVGKVLDVRVRPDDSRVSDTGVSTARPSVVYRGQTSALRRLIQGVDFDEIREAHIKIEDDLRRRLETLHYELLTPVTTQDAVDFAYFLVETTIKMQRFSDGTAIARRTQGKGPVPGCGGPIQGLVVDAHGVEWITRNDLVRPATLRMGSD